MGTITLKISDELAQQFREFALKETGTMRGLSIVAEKAFIEYMGKHNKNKMGKPKSRGSRTA